jgi:phosphocarrier protein
MEPHIAAKFAVVASRFNGNISVACKGQAVNAKSVTAVMNLGAQHNDLVELHAEGDQAQQAINALIEVIQENG